MVLTHPGRPVGPKKNNPKKKKKKKPPQNRSEQLVGRVPPTAKFLRMGELLDEIENLSGKSIPRT
jgi:hypothetical protein